MGFLEIPMRLSVESALILCIFHVYKWKNECILCNYLGEGKGGGVTLMHAYVGNTKSAFTTELLDECLRNSVGMK